MQSAATPRMRQAIGHPYNPTEQEVLVWPVRIFPSRAAARHFQALLTPDETERAESFRFDYLRQSFVIARGVLRTVLGRYLGISPDGVQFQYGARGKPALAGHTRLRFNASHSGNLAVFAFSLDCELGVDIEQIRPMPEMREIAERFFCPDEQSELCSLPAHERDSAFYRCWTRKEAFLKALGDGLYAPLDSLRVTLRAADPARLVHIAGDAHAAQAWTLHDLLVDPEYAAALAYKGAPRALTILRVQSALDLVHHS